MLVNKGCPINFQWYNYRIIYHVHVLWIQDLNFGLFQCVWKNGKNGETDQQQYDKEP